MLRPYVFLTVLRPPKNQTRSHYCAPGWRDRAKVAVDTCAAIYFRLSATNVGASARAMMRAACELCQGTVQPS